MSKRKKFSKLILKDFLFLGYNKNREHSLTEGDGLIRLASWLRWLVFLSGKMFCISKEAYLNYLVQGCQLY